MFNFKKTYCHRLAVAVRRKINQNGMQYRNSTLLPWSNRSCKQCQTSC